MLSSPDVWKEFFEVYYENEITKLAMDVCEGIKGTLYVNVGRDLINFREGKLFEELLMYPDKVLKHAEDGLSKVHNIYGVSLSGCRVRFKNIPPRRRILVKQLEFRHINRFVSIECIVRKITEPKPCLTKAVFICETCGEKISVIPSGRYVSKPRRCPFCNSKEQIELSIDDSELTNIQRIQVQDLPENLDSGESPRLLNVVLMDELINSVFPGDKIIVNGIVRVDVNGSRIRRDMDIFLDVNSVEFLQQDFRSLRITESDKKKIEELAKRPDIYDLLVRSIAPSIYGYDDIKLAIALQIFGGVSKVNPDGTKSRGDIHILLVGDPSTAKSQILRSVKQIAPRAILATGVSSSGVGLTASTVRDEDGRWTLEAGVLVLADRGIALIDEIEKMGKDDRYHMLEALEQQSYHKDTEIMLADGRKVRIGELVDRLIEENRERVIYGRDTEILPVDEIFILAYDLDKMQTVVAKVDRVSRHLAPDRFVRITFSNGRSIVVTPEHPVLVWDGSGIREVPAEAVKKGMIVPAVRRYDLAPGRANAARCASSWISGAISNRFNLRSAGYLPVRSKVRSKLPGISGSERRIHHSIMCSPEHIRISFLRNFFRSHGILNESYAVIKVKSREMAEDIQDLLLTLGIYSTISPEEFGYDVKVSEEDLGRFRLLLRCGRVVKERGVECEKNFRLIRVERVEVVENGDSKWVYDVTVEPYHVFVSHGLILHNTITISKAGINATLNARCSVLASANPRHGRFNKYEPILDQVNLEPPLLSRFDLIFLILDEPDEERDRTIADYILADIDKSPVIPPDLLRKYILYAKRKIKKIVLTENASKKIKEFYMKLRKISKEQGAVAITARQLEALRRLTEASAKIRLSEVATEEDAERAIRVFKKSLEQVAIDPESGKIDIDYAFAGVSATQRDRIAIIKKIIEELEKENERGAPEEEIISRAEERGLGRDKVEEILLKLKQKGEVYCPRYGFYKVVKYE